MLKTQSTKTVAVALAVLLVFTTWERRSPTQRWAKAA